MNIVTVADGAATTTTHAIAVGVGNHHSTVIRLVRDNIDDLQDFGGVGFEIRPFETRGGPQKQEIAVLNEQQATLLLTYMRNNDIVRAFKKRLVKAFYEFRDAVSPQAQSTLPETQAAESIESTLKIGQLLGTEPEMARVIAVKRAYEVSGYDATPLLGQQQAVKETPETPTKLGKRIGLSPRDMNLELESSGMQVKNNGQWEPTAEGNPFCTMNPYQSKHSDHTGYRVLWRPSVLSHLGYQAAA